MIDLQRCKELNLPIPRKNQTQPSYILTCISTGHKINTRICRYIGIYNLHSVISKIKERHYPVTVEHRIVWCPQTKTLPFHPVDVVYMTQEQRKSYLINKKPAKA
jgi:hypothetical protein